MWKYISRRSITEQKQPLLIWFFADVEKFCSVFFNNSPGMDGIFRGGVRDIGEFRKFIKKSRSYTIRVPKKKMIF